LLPSEGSHIPARLSHITKEAFVISEEAIASFCHPPEAKQLLKIKVD